MSRSTTPPRADRAPDRRVATAVITFLTTSLVHEPRPVGKRCEAIWPGSGRLAAAAYRVLSRLREDTRESS